MAATFPGGVKVFTTKQAGDQIASAHINDLQDEVVAVETELRKTSGSVVSHGSLAGLSNNDHPQYLLTTGKAADSDKLDGNDSAYFMPISYKDGWQPDSDTWVYVSATQFKITGKNVVYRFPVGAKIKLTQSGSVKYFYVIACSYSTDTTITITGGSDYTLASATISGQAYSYADTPQGYPFGTVTIRVERSTNQSIPNNTWTALSFDTIVSEEKPATTGQWSSGDPTKLICRLPGYYLINAHVRIAQNATGARGINIMKNGTALIANIFSPASGFDSHFQVNATVKLDTGDYIEAKAFQDSGAALDAVATSNNLYIEWIRLGI